MRLGLSTYTFTWSIGVPGQIPGSPMTAVNLLERAVSLGVGVVQMADNLPLDELAESELADFENYARAHQLQIEVGTRGIDPDHLRRYLDLARRFHSPILRVVIDTANHHPSPAEAVETLCPLRGEFESAGVTLAIENHDRFQTPALAWMIDQLGGWTGICLDTVNSFGALEGPRVVVDALGPYTINLHVKDFTIFRASHMMGFTVEGRPAGQGRLDIPWLLAELQKYGRDFNAILELWTPSEATLDETIRKEQRWAAESVQNLRGWIER